MAAMVRFMIKILEQAIEKVKALSTERQEYAAEVLEQIANTDDAVYHLSDIDEILAYIHQRSPIGAHNVSPAIEYTVHCVRSIRERERRPTSPTYGGDHWVPIYDLLQSLSATTASRLRV